MVLRCVQQWAFEMLERCAMKVARTVLRGGGGSNAISLPDLAAQAVVGDLGLGAVGWG